MSGRDGRLKNVRWLVLGLLAAVAVIVISVYLAGLLSAQSSSSPGSCPPHPRITHQVIIQNGAVMPSNTDANRCDGLAITNLDGTNRLVAFGEHEHHTPYDGVEEKLLSQGQSLTVVLNRDGNYRFHDHLDDKVQGTFSVE